MFVPVAIPITETGGDVPMKEIASLTMILGLMILIAACSGTASKTTAPVAGGNCLANGTSVLISANHGHVMTVTNTEVNADATKPYDIQGAAGHTHTVTLAKTDFDSLKLNQGVSVQSTAAPDGHSHTITVNCQ
jgi:hypothetical protein